jgi:hypothetical protein
LKILDINRRNGDWLLDCIPAQSDALGIDMKTVQLAIRDSDYAQSLRNSLLRDGTHQVYLVDQPDLRIDGVVVIDGSGFENVLSPCEPERFVVITRKGSDSLSRLWDAGIRHVVFEGDSPTTAQLAVIAAELRLPGYEPKSGRDYGAASEKRRTGPRPGFPVLDTTPHCGRCIPSRHKDFRGF